MPCNAAMEVQMRARVNQSLWPTVMGIVAVVFTTNCADGTDERPSQGVPNSQASWAFSASSIEELKAGTDIGVLATIERLIVDPDNKSLPSGALELATVHVDRVLWHANPEDSPESITFAYTVQADPPTKNQDRWILYFQEYGTGKYRAVGPSGWFAVSPGDLVTAVPDSGIVLPLNITVDEFARL